MKLPWPFHRNSMGDRLHRSSSDRELLFPDSERVSPVGSENLDRRNVNGEVCGHDSEVYHSSDMIENQPKSQHAPRVSSSPISLFGNNTIECPTCQGKGKLSQGQADSMVALIPVKDARLKPRRTKLYILLTVCFCLLVFGLIAVFLMPRSVSVKLIDAESYNISIVQNASLTPHIDMNIKFSVKNQNFFSVKFSNLDFQVSWNKGLLYVNSTTEDFSIPARSSKTTIKPITTYFLGDQAKNIRDVCLDGWKWRITEKFSATASVVYLGRTEQISDSSFFFIDCYGIFSPWKQPDWTKR